MPRGVRLLDLRSVCSSSEFYGLWLNNPLGEGIVLQAYKTLEQHWRRATYPRNRGLCALCAKSAEEDVWFMF
jgi:hypothetical protein